MVRTDFTPWEPGIIALDVQDVACPNPYNGGVIPAFKLLELVPVIGQVCYQVDTYISLIQQQSKHWS